MNFAMNSDLLNRILCDDGELEKCLKWLSSQKDEDICPIFGEYGFTKIDFVIFFLNYLRLQTASFFEQKRVKLKSDWKRCTPIITDKPNSSVKPLSTTDTVRRLFSPECNEDGGLVSPIKHRPNASDERHSYQNTRATTSQKLLFNPQIYDQNVNFSMNQAPIHQQGDSKYPIHQMNAGNLSMNQSQNSYPLLQQPINSNSVLRSNTIQINMQSMSPTTQDSPWRSNSKWGVPQVMSPTNLSGPWRTNSAHAVPNVMSPPSQTGGAWSNLQGVGLIMSHTKQNSTQGVPQVMSFSTPGHAWWTNSTKVIPQVMSPPNQTCGPWNNLQGVGLIMSPTKQNVVRTNSTRAVPQVMSPPAEAGQITNANCTASQVTYHTPRRTNFHKSNTSNSLLFSNSSSSSGGVLSPDSPRDCRKFAGSEERGRRGAGGGATPKNLCIGDFIVGATKKQDKQRKRIKPTQLSTKSGDASQLDDVSKTSNNPFTTVPESSAANTNQSNCVQNFDEERKLLKQYNKKMEGNSKNTSKTSKELQETENKKKKDNVCKTPMKKVIPKKEPTENKPEEEFSENICEKGHSKTAKENNPALVVPEFIHPYQKTGNISKTPKKEVKSKEEMTLKVESTGNKKTKEDFCDDMSEKRCTKMVKEKEPKFIKAGSKVTNPLLLKKLAIIYCALLDNNLVFNVTKEMHFVISLLTVKVIATINKSDKFVDGEKFGGENLTEQNANLVVIAKKCDKPDEVILPIMDENTPIKEKNLSIMKENSPIMEENLSIPEPNVNSVAREDEISGVGKLQTSVTSPSTPSSPPPSTSSSPSPPPLSPPPPQDSNKEVKCEKDILGVRKLQTSITSPLPSSPPPPPPTSSSPPTPPPLDSNNDANNLLSDVHNSVFFACYVLENQLRFLKLLDRRTLKLLAQNDKIKRFSGTLKRKLESIYSAQIPAKTLKPQSTTNQESICPVQFHPDTDSRWTFSSDNSFATFRKQRDELYSILQAWSKMQQVGVAAERGVANSNKGVADSGANFNFNKLKPRVEKLLAMSHDPINIRHLAKHFCDLLLKAVGNCEENIIEELENLPDVNRNKLTLLTKRLTEPSTEKNVSPRPETSFPGFQQFYHDFLVIASQNFLFNVHMINCFVNEIKKRCDATYDIDESEGEGQVVQDETRHTFVQGLSALCVLAKFLGLIVFAPYRTSLEIPKSVLQEEINIRKQLDLPLPLDAHLNAALKCGRLVYTVPWVVEFLGMMDAVAPHLPCYQNVFVTLYNVYLVCKPQGSLGTADDVKEVQVTADCDKEFESADGKEMETADGKELEETADDGKAVEVTADHKEVEGTADKGSLGTADGDKELEVTADEGSLETADDVKKVEETADGDKVIEETADGVSLGRAVGDKEIDETDGMELKKLAEFLFEDEREKLGKCLSTDEIMREFLFEREKMWFVDGCHKESLVHKDKVLKKVRPNDGVLEKSVEKEVIQGESTIKDGNQAENLVAQDVVSGKLWSKDGHVAFVSKDGNQNELKFKDGIHKEFLSEDGSFERGNLVDKDTFNDELLSKFKTTKSASKDLSQADNFECRMEFFKKILHDSSNCEQMLQLSPLVSALLRLSLGWLFDSENFPQELLSRVAQKSNVDQFLVDKIQTTRNNLTMDSCSDLVTHEIIHKLCPYLKSYYTVLAKSNSVISMTTHKHVTPISSNLMSSTVIKTTQILPEISIQLQLEDHFFMGQSESVKRTVEFVSERIASACIKEIINSVIVELKKNLTDLLELNTAQNKKVNLQPLISDYKSRVMSQLTAVKESRLGVALNALLGPDLNQKALDLCQQITARKFQERVINWLQTHINIEEILLKVLTNYEKEQKISHNNDEDDALEDFFKVEKFEQNKIDPDKNSNKKFSIDDVTVCSKTLIHIQEMASDALESFGKQGIKNATEVLELIADVEKSLKKCSSQPIRKQICIALLDYVILMISFRPNEATDPVLERLVAVTSDDFGGLEVSSHLWSPRNVMLLMQGGGESLATVWPRRLSRLTVALVKENVLDVPSLERQMVALFRCTWPDNVLQTISEAIRYTVDDLKRKTSCDAEFLDLLSDIALDIRGDIEYDL